MKTTLAFVLQGQIRILQSPVWMKTRSFKRIFFPQVLFVCLLFSRQIIIRSMAGPPFNTSSILRTNAEVRAWLIDLSYCGVGLFFFFFFGGGCCCFCFFVWGKVFQCSPGWLVHQADLQLVVILLPVPLQLQVCTRMLGLKQAFFSCVAFCLL